MKNLLKCAVIAAITFAFLGASTLVAQDWTKEQTELWQTIENAWTKWQEGDFDASFANIHEKYQGWNQEDPLPTTKEKWRKSIEAWKEYTSLDYYNNDPARILIYVDVAVVHYYTEYLITYTKDEEKKEYHYKGKNTEFYIKEDGEWMLIGDMSVWKDKK